MHICRSTVTIRSILCSIFSIFSVDLVQEVTAAVWPFDVSIATTFLYCADDIALRASKFYQHILSTEAGCHIYTSRWPVIKGKANFCA